MVQNVLHLRSRFARVNRIKEHSKGSPRRVSALGFLGLYPYYGHKILIYSAGFAVALGVGKTKLGFRV